MDRGRQIKNNTLVSYQKNPTLHVKQKAKTQGKMFVLLGVKKCQNAKLRSNLFLLFGLSPAIP